MKAELKGIVAVYHPKGCLVERHTHPYHELVYCLEGEGTVELGNREIPFSAGNYYITCAGTQHVEKDTRTTRIIYFYFDTSMEPAFEGVYTDFDGSVLAGVKRLLRESQKNFPLKEEMLQSLIIQILIEAQRAADPNTVETAFSALLQYINENIEQNVDFRRLAVQQNYSYDRFRHIFKTYTGQSPHQYVIGARIEKAKFLLTLHPRASFTAISLNCGFSSPSQFSNSFRSRVGMSPTQYIRSKVNKP